MRIKDSIKIMVREGEKDPLEMKKTEREGKE